MRGDFHLSGKRKNGFLHVWGVGNYFWMRSCGDERGVARGGREKKPLGRECRKEAGDFSLD